MNMEKLNQWLSLVANLGVVLGIVFLAVEMRLNTNMTRAQTRDAMTEKQLEFYSHIITDSETAKAWESYRGDDLVIDDDYISETKSVHLLLSQLRMWENELYQYRQGLFESQEFQSRLALWESLMNGQGGRSAARRAVWEGQQFSFAKDFREVLNDLIRTNQ